MHEREAIERLRRIATDPRGARPARRCGGARRSGAHPRHALPRASITSPADPPASVGWKLVAVNLSDLAAKGATPLAALLSLTLNGDGEWEIAFLDGVEAACESYGLPLVGGDTIALPADAPRVLGLTAIGKAGPNVPARSGGRSGRPVMAGRNARRFGAAGLAELQADPEGGGPAGRGLSPAVPLLAAGALLAPLARR